MLFASYVAGLNGVPGKQVRYASPVSLEEAIRIAVSVQEAERQEKFNNSFYARHDSRTYSDSENSRHAIGHVRPARQRVDARKCRGMLTEEEPRALGTRRPRLPYAVTNAKV
jgi:hypothetical protein